MPQSSQEYVQEQKRFESKYPVFTKAKILRSAQDFENGWGLKWVSQLNDFIGKEIEIYGYSNFYGVMTKECHYVPFFVLEPIIESIPKKVIHDRMTISLDFDGTCVTQSYPDIGYDIGAAPVLRELVTNGHRLILNTMRHHPEYYENKRSTLNEAVKWFDDNSIELFGIQKHPNQHSWTTSTKVHADYIIDDTAIGCPLKFDKSISNAPFVDWYKMRNELVKLGLL